MILRLRDRRLALTSAAVLALTLASACAGAPAGSDLQSQAVVSKQAGASTDPGTVGPGPNAVEVLADSSAEGGPSPASVLADDGSAGDLLALDDEADRFRASSRGGNRGSGDDDSSEAAPVAEAVAEAATPQPEPARVAAEPTLYEVVAGDTLLDIAERFGISADTIIWANELAGDADDLQVGQSLTILPVSGVLHQIGPGDTLVEIAEGYGVELSAVVETNALTDADTIAEGHRLVIPGGKPLIVASPSSPGSVTVDARGGEAAQSVAPPAGRTGKGAAIVEIAARFNGYDYTWGGHSPATGFDCTGFTWYVYGQAGLTIPLHDLWGQLGAGPRLSQSDLLPGDLVFFQNTYQPGLSHAGLYVGGRRFIHAASEGFGVRYDSLDDSYWGPRYFGASRPW